MLNLKNFFARLKQLPLFDTLLSSNLLKLWLKPPSYMGLSFSDQGIDVLLLAGSENHYTILDYAHLPLPLGAIIDQKIKSPENVGAVLAQLRMTLKHFRRQVVIALPDTHVITKQISLPGGLSEFEVESEIEFAAAKNIPLPMENVSLDYHVLGPSESEPGQENVLLIASLSAPIEEYLQLLESAELTAAVVDVDSYVLQRSLAYCVSQLDPATPQNVVTLFNFNGNVISFVALYKDNIVYHHEEIFISDESMQDVQAMLLNQITQCLQSFSSETLFERVDLLFLSGDKVIVSGIEATLSKELGIPVSLANPLVNMHFSEAIDTEDLKKRAPALMSVVGLALRGCV